ncbi:DUF1003 domain-containing protein [Phenylobacterium sp. 20VBR1]|uniref:DUF1003 domain-containing protein n=1 Tax=Phenylobacterium glaciei TaxID=2803784 RepID=A0A941CYS4_9CAUL|nr:DUF1003 domain-containing protein [Phenylobacterium glaciei]MBR7619150.1 DUF1003 domain-containing protein [Phenylobacterium glaciei]
MSSDALDDNVEETVEAVAKLHQDHHQAAGVLQRGLDGVTGLLAKPPAMVLLILAVTAWILGNRFGPGWPDPDFVGLELGATLAALLVTLLILVTQSRDDRLAERREKLTLELALLNEQKSAKIISLLEELRRDAPSIADRRDEESEAMGKPTDAASVLSEIENRTARPAVLKKD